MSRERFEGGGCRIRCILGVSKYHRRNRRGLTGRLSEKAPRPPRLPGKKAGSGRGATWILR